MDVDTELKRTNINKFAMVAEDSAITNTCGPNTQKNSVRSTKKKSTTQDNKEGKLNNFYRFFLIEEIITKIENQGIFASCCPKKDSNEKQDSKIELTKPMN